MQVFAVRPTLTRLRAGVHQRTSFMSSSLLFNSHLLPGRNSWHSCRLGNWKLITWSREASLPGYTGCAEFIARHLRRPNRGMPTEPRIFGLAAQESQFVCGYRLYNDLVSYIDLVGSRLNPFPSSEQYVLVVLLEWFLRWRQMAILLQFWGVVLLGFV